MRARFQFHDPRRGNRWDSWDYFHNGWLYGPTGYEAGHAHDHKDSRDWTYTNPYSRLSGTHLPYRHALMMKNLRDGVDLYLHREERGHFHRLLDVIDNAIRTMNGFCSHGGRDIDRVVQFNRKFTDGSVIRMEGKLSDMADDILRRWTQNVCKSVLDRTFVRCGLDRRNPDQKNLPAPEIWNRVFTEEFFSDLAARESERWKSRLFCRREPRPEKAMCYMIQLMKEWEAVWFGSEKLLAETIATHHG
ncbi:hypothetical protein Micbo1qcDRAFT_206216 [Microdochium bolleyi]|uniref:Uncharacterized protein n=1 Tax=Microdochium bolleyi TaxID=196109 RepID=A0A136IWF9_9PEZI|nr:hypothetical protein Micbo1qcDRAFT_206216 [Microdochium bolleyi]